jgi:hypothetical protein
VIKLDEWMPAAADAVREQFPDAPWSVIDHLDRMINWELWHGCLPDDYWTNVEPVETPWISLQSACNRLIEAMECLPGELWWDADWGGLYVSDPEGDDGNWQPTGDEDNEDLVWVGPERAYSFDPRQAILYAETWKQVF